MQQNPQLANSFLQSDPRMIDVLGALMGLDMQGFSRPEGSDDLPQGFSSTSPPPAAASSTSKPAPSQPTPSTSSAAPDVEMKDPEPAEEDEDAKAKKEAEQQKQLGGAAYKKRDLEAAEQHFSKAWEVWPKDITYLTNLGGESLFVPLPSHGRN